MEDRLSGILDTLAQGGTFTYGSEYEGDFVPSSSLKANQGLGTILDDFTLPLNLSNLGDMLSKEPYSMGVNRPVMYVTGVNGSLFPLHKEDVSPLSALLPTDPYVVGPVLAHPDGRRMEGPAGCTNLGWVYTGEAPQG